jgi:hypothetical protein
MFNKICGMLFSEGIYMELEAVEKFSVALLLLFAKSADHFAEKLEEVFEPQGQAAGG